MISNTPAVVRSAAVITAVSCVADTKVVILSPPANFTTDDDMKLVPLTIIVNSASPAFLNVGEIDVVVGTGFPTVNC